MKLLTGESVEGQAILCLFNEVFYRGFVEMKQDYGGIYLAKSLGYNAFELLYVPHVRSSEKVFHCGGMGNTAMPPDCLEG